MPYKVNPTTGQLDYYEVSEGGGGGVATNLAFIPSPTSGTVTSDSGTDADITLATTTNSGLFSPAEKIKLGIALTSVGVNYRNTYNNGLNYGIGDVVLYNGILYERISNPNNPGYPPGTTSWGLFDVDLGSPAFDLWIRNVLTNKVDVVSGMGLSTEDYTTAEQTKLAGISGTNTGDQSLQQVTDIGNTTTNDIQFGIGKGALLNNGSRLREGTIDAGFGGTKGIAQICAVGYELKWEAGRLYVMDGNGVLIRHSLYNFTTLPSATDDYSKGYYVGSLWTLDNGISYICTDSTLSAATWDIYEATPQVNADWNAISGVAQILNKPTSLPTANVKHSVKYAEALTIGQAVYVSGANGTNMLVSKADNSAEATSSKTMGLVTASGAANYQGQVITEGLLAGLDTSTATIGDAVWLGTNGNLIFWHYGLTTKPVAPNHLVFIGIVTRVSATVGEIFVKPQNGFEIDELHDVSVVGRTDNSLLGYVSSTGLHVFKTVAQWLGYTPANKAGETFTGAISATNLSGTNSGDNAVNSLYSGLAASKQNAITLTTTGYEGVATLSGSTLNIPAYKSVFYSGNFAGGDAYNAGDVVLYNNNLYYCILTIGSASAPSGDATHWSLFLPGSGTITLTTTGTSGAATLVGSTLNVPNYGVASVPQSITNSSLIFYSNNC